MPVQQSAGDVIVTVAEDGCGDGHGVAENSLCRVATAVDLWLNFLDNDASASFNRFHITQILRFDFRIPWYSRSPHFTCVCRKAKGPFFRDASRASGVCSTRGQRADSSNTLDKKRT